MTEIAIIDVPIDALKFIDNRINRSILSREEYEWLKKQILWTGQKKPIVITPQMEVLDGEKRVTIFRELYAETHDEFYKTIKAITITPEKEIKELEQLLKDSEISDYEYDTAAYRLMQLIPEDVEWHFNDDTILVGEAIAKSWFADEIILEYKRKNLTHKDMVNKMKEISLPKSEIADGKDLIAEYSQTPDTELMGDNAPSDSKFRSWL